MGGMLYIPNIVGCFGLLVLKMSKCETAKEIRRIR